MKNLVTFLAIIFSIYCHAQKTKSKVTYTYSFTVPMLGVYEDLVIVGTKANYSYKEEREKKKQTKDFTLSKKEVKNLEQSIKENSFATIRQEISDTGGPDGSFYSISVKKGKDEVEKVSQKIIKEEVVRWRNMVKVFEDIIKTHVDFTDEK